MGKTFLSKARDSEGNLIGHVNTAYQSLQKLKRIKNARSVKAEQAKRSGDEWKKYNAKFNLTMVDSIAYLNGFYMHSSATSFDRAVKNLDLLNTIKNALEQSVNTLDSRISEIQEKVKPTEEERKAFEKLANRSEVEKMFDRLKKSLSTPKMLQLRSMDKKTINTEYTKYFGEDAVKEVKDRIASALREEVNTVFDDKDKLKPILINGIENFAKSLTKQKIVQIIKIGKIAQGNRKGNYTTKRDKTNAKERELFSMESISNFYAIASVLGEVNRSVQESGTTDQRYLKAASSLDLIENIANNFETLVTNIKQKKKEDDDEDKYNSVGFSYGFNYESLEKYLKGGKLLGATNDDRDATDIIYNLENIRASLKTSNIIFRTQDIESFLKSTSNRELLEEDIKNVLNPIKYFYMNFGLILEAEDSELNTIKKNTKTVNYLSGTKLMSCSNVMNIYNYLSGVLGKYFSTNMIVGFILKNWNGKVDELPKVVLSSGSDIPFPTYDLLESLKQNSEDLSLEGNYIYPDITGKMIEEYDDFVTSKSAAVSKIVDSNKEVTYSTILEDSKVSSLYGSLTESGKTMNFLTSVDIALLLEKLNRKGAS